MQVTVCGTVQYNTILCTVTFILYTLQVTIYKYSTLCRGILQYAAQHFTVLYVYAVLERFTRSTQHSTVYRNLHAVQYTDYGISMYSVTQNICFFILEFAN